MNFVLRPPSPFILSPRRGNSGGRFLVWRMAVRQIQSREFPKSGERSPSPWGEGRDEGGREPFEIRMPQGQRGAWLTHELGETGIRLVALKSS